MKNIKKRIGLMALGIFILGSVAFQSDFFEIAKQIEIYTELFKQLDMYYIDEINPAQLNEIAMKNMLKSLDPYTVFYDEQGIEDVRIKRSGEYGGIGSYTRFRDKHLYILEPYKDSPAAKSGIKAGDEIIQIDDVIVKDYEEEGVGNLLRGTPGTIVEIKVIRQGETKDFTVERAKIDINPVPFYDMIDEEVGYISLIKFNKKTSPEVRKAINDLKSRGMNKLVFDIRGNPGGLLSEAIAITNLFVPKGKLVVTTKSKVKKWSKEYKTKRNALDTVMPVVVLINDRSASASEIVSGSLQDYDRAVIMGERSYGKGLVQRYRKLAYGTQMKLTISKYYTPSGRCIQELDYTNRNKDGNVPKFSDGKVNTFKTQNGRKVFDGGGVLPDLEIDKPKTLKLTKALYQSQAFFDFITNYYYQNKQINTADKFNLDPNVFDSLKLYLLDHNENFKTNSEKEFEKAIDLTEKEGFKEQIQESFNQFKKEVANKKIQQLEKNKIEIIEKITEEIIKRYYYREGVFQQKLSFDPTIVKATSLLHDKRKYNRLLK
jgi:carboxyl-terminal processing protease